VGWEVTTAPLVEAVHPEEIRSDHLRVDDGDELEHIRFLIRAVTANIEKLYSLALITQTVTEYFDGWPECGCRVIKLAVRPVASVTSVKYYDDDGVLQTLSSSLYRTDTVSLQARVELDDDESWPDLDYRTNAVQIEYTAGYGATSQAVPENIRHAINLMVGTLYENREDVSDEFVMNRSRQLLAPDVIINI